MSAYLTTSYKKGFFLTEEALIKLDDIIRKRLDETDQKVKVIFKVYRTDGMLLEYESPGEVVGEENAVRNAVKRIDIVGLSNTTRLKMIFDSQESVDLQLNSENRDLAYLLFSDLKEYLTAEILKFMRFTFKDLLSSPIFMPVLIILIPIFAFIFIRDTPNSEAIEAIVQSSDVQQKLNFLIQQTVKKDDLGNLKYLIFAMFGMMIVPTFLGLIMDKTFPRNVFYWGKCATSYDRLISIRDKIFWGVGITFVIGIASTVAVDIFKRGS